MNDNYTADKQETTCRLDTASSPTSSMGRTVASCSPPAVTRLATWAAVSWPDTRSAPRCCSACSPQTARRTGRHRRLLAVLAARGVTGGWPGGLPAALAHVDLRAVPAAVGVEGGPLFVLQPASGPAAGLGYVALFALLAPREHPLRPPHLLGGPIAQASGHLARRRASRGRRRPKLWQHPRSTQWKDLGVQIAIVLHPGVTGLDAVRPYEVLRLLPDAEVRFGPTPRRQP